MKFHSPIRPLLMIILLLVCTGCHGLLTDYDSSVHPSEDLIRVLGDAPIARITYRDDEGGSCGTAIYIGNHEFLTALHVLLDGENHVRNDIRIEGCPVSITLLDIGTISENGDLIDEQDWAHFRSSDCDVIPFMELRLSHGPIDMNPVLVKPGDTVFLIGFPRLYHSIHSYVQYERLPLSIIEGQIVRRPFLWPNVPDDIFVVKPRYARYMPSWSFVGMSGGLVVKLETDGFHAVGIAVEAYRGFLAFRHITPEIIQNGDTQR